MDAVKEAKEKLRSFTSSKTVLEAKKSLRKQDVNFSEIDLKEELKALWGYFK